jgi:BirA family biotin operon repressor/biotin-[acetyl-CoA-carboxylase] ligase
MRSSDLDPLDFERELTRLGCSVGRPATIAASTASTNDDARAAAKAGAPHGAVFIADAQTSGRGRAGHTWHSPPGENIYLSLLLRPAWPAPRLQSATLAVGVAVADVVDAELPDSALRASIKWPNDVEHERRKLGGILVEAQLRGGEISSLVVGVGLNVRTDSFPNELADRATSLARIGVRLLNRSVIAARLVASMDRALTKFGEQGLAPFAAELARRDALRGAKVQAGTGVVGRASGIDAEGRLVVCTEAGETIPVVAGEAVVLER